MLWLSTNAQVKIRYIGVSNETAFGVMRYLHLADKHDLPRIVTIQNPYSLLNRSFEVGLAEVSSMKESSCWLIHVLVLVR